MVVVHFFAPLPLVFMGYIFPVSGLLPPFAQRNLKWLLIHIFPICCLHQPDSPPSQRQRQLEFHGFVNCNSNLVEMGQIRRRKGSEALVRTCVRFDDCGKDVKQVARSIRARAIYAFSLPDEFEPDVLASAFEGQVPHLKSPTINCPTMEVVRILIQSGPDARVRSEEGKGRKRVISFENAGCNSNLVEYRTGRLNDRQSDSRKERPGSAGCQAGFSFHSTLGHVGVGRFFFFLTVFNIRPTSSARARMVVLKQEARGRWLYSGSRG
ncbi:hypothetical protein DFH06DRAFT_1150789 [Mycena polygramma]|nr:hypothetical protein DFH06DRAFT_1150789 [Mycena polygramma]